MILVAHSETVAKGNAASQVRGSTELERADNTRSIDTLTEVDSSQRVLSPLRQALLYTPASGGRRARWKAITFLVFVLFPGLIGVLYYYGIASDQFVSEMRFGIRSVESSAASSSGLLRGLGVADQSGTDSHALVQYIQSREIIAQLQERINIRAMFSRDSADFLSRFNRNRSIEDLVEYWDRQTDSFYETSTGTVVVRIRAFTREDALQISQEVHSLSEALVNELSAKARQDSVQFAEKEVGKAEQRLLNAQLAMRQLRDKEGILDPRKNAEATMALIAKLRGELTLAQTEMQAQNTFLSYNSPVLNVLRQRIASLEVEIAKLQAEVTSSPNVERREVLSRVISDYENAEIEKQFAERYYATTLEALQRARIEAERQQKYLATFVRPSLPEDPLYPKRTRSALTVIAIAFGIWGLGLLVVSSVRDHM
ncbi:MAG: hypothetical protein O9342_06990 [Beijerinckiaceae bacterium]|nr:hypothetical protein [Beijerinckiaceae bacterium]